MKSTRRTKIPSTPRGNEPFGITGWLEKTRFALPLKGVECGFDVRGDVVDVEIDQIYYQSASKPMDCMYSFPLPAGAAVYNCELHVNDRVIRARVEEAQEARRIYTEKKAEGRRAGLVEVERENLFTLSLGNLQPEDVVVVRFAYFQTLARLGDQLTVQIPVCPGIRYIPGRPLLRGLSGKGTEDDTDETPDASRISPPRIDALHPDAAYFSLIGQIDPKAAITDTISSPTHTVAVHGRTGSVSIAVALAGMDAMPDRDFVLRWSEPKEVTLNSLAWRYSDGDTYALVQLRAPEIAQRDESYEQDVYFLIDRSGSMGGKKWIKTCEALHAFMDILGERDRAWITFFESTHRDFAEKPLPAKIIATDRAFRKIERIGTAGGTELLPALKHVLGEIGEHSSGRRAVLLILTDGQIGNEDHVLESLRKQPGLTVHAFGIDTTVNDALLKNIAKQQRGQCFLLTPEDDISGVIAKLGDRIRRPVLTRIEIQGDWEVASETIPDLFSGEVIDIPLRSSRDGSRVRIKGFLPDGGERSFDFNCATVKNPAIKLLWARGRIETLLATKLTADAIILAKQNNLLCQGTCFIAWDEAERVSIGCDQVYQPSLEPHMVLAAQAPVGRRFGISPHTLASICLKQSFGDFIEGFEVLEDRHPAPPERREVMVSRRLAEIGSRYQGWREETSIMLAEAINEWAEEMAELLPIEEKVRRVVLALLCFWAGQRHGLGDDRVELLVALREELRGLAGNSGAACEAVMRFVTQRCDIDEQMREDCRCLSEICGESQRHE